MADELLRAVRLRRYAATLRGKATQVLEETSKAYEIKMRRLQELTDWLVQARQDAKRIPPDHPAHANIPKVEAMIAKIEGEIEEIELQQEAALTELVKESGSLVLELEDGTHRVLATQKATAGGGEALLPRELLAVWRVARVFEGSIVLGDKPTRLQFGDATQVATVKLAAKRKCKKGAVVGEEASLFGKD